VVNVPERIGWAVELLDVAPRDRILELGCGPGVAARLVCDRLDGLDGDGRLTAIDRSAVAVQRARERNAEHVTAGRLVVEQVELAKLEGEPDRFDKAFAVNVNVFWTSPADAECAVLTRALRPGGTLLLVYAGPPPAAGARPGSGPQPDQGRDVGPQVAATLERHGFTTTVIHHPDASMVAITGSLDP
jgi:SAM-dependent methyltransferase